MKFKYQDEVEIITGFYRGQKGKIEDYSRPRSFFRKSEIIYKVKRIGDFYSNTLSMKESELKLCEKSNGSA